MKKKIQDYFEPEPLCVRRATVRRVGWSSTMGREEERIVEAEIYQGEREARGHTSGTLMMASSATSGSFRLFQM